MSTHAGVCAIPGAPPDTRATAFARRLLIGLTAFLTLVDLFATQAILPTLTRHYGVTPAAMGFAVNASTIGMAISGLVVAFFSRRIDRRLGIFVALALLAVPTALLALAPDLATFTALRIAQGLCMSAAFTLMLAYLAEHCSAQEVAGAFAAYITGNVASNLFGRLLSAALADHVGLAGNFVVFSALNLGGALLVWFTLGRTPALLMPMGADRSAWSPFAIWAEHLRNPALRVAFALGFLILFVFLGTFTYVNFVLARPPLALSAMALGVVYFVFVPAVITTPLAGRLVGRFGVRPACLAGLAVAAAGLPLLALPKLPAVLAGMVLLAAGTFFAQATTTGFVGRAATADRAAANGLYLASYFLGGLVGAAVLGQVFDALGWNAVVAGLGVALALAALLASQLKLPAERLQPVPAAA